MKKVVRFSPTATSRALSLPAAAAARVLLRKWLLPEALRVDMACTAEQAIASAVRGILRKLK